MNTDTPFFSTLEGSDVSVTEPDMSVSKRPIAAFRLTRSVAIQWILVSVVGFFAFAYCFGHVLAAIRGVSLEPIVISASSLPDGTGWLLGVLGSVVLVVVPHELLHGVFMARFGGSPSYGVGASHFVLPYAYAETRNAEYTRNQMLIVLLAPVTLITAVGLGVMVIYPSPLLLIPLAANAAGSIGDLWMAAVLCQYPADVYVAELPRGETQGFGIYDVSETATGRHPGANTLSTLVTGAVGTLAVSTMVLVGLVFQSLAFGTGTVVIDFHDWMLFRHELQASGIVLELGGRPLTVLSITGGVAWTLLTEMWRSFR